MRNICIIVEDIYDIALLHINELCSIGKKNLIYDLRKLKESMTYSAPEFIKSTYYFEVLSNILSIHISNDDYKNIPYCKEIIDIFLDPNYKINNNL